MKTPLYKITRNAGLRVLLLLTSALWPLTSWSQSESVDDKVVIAGASVDAANDFTLVRDASVLSGPALKKLKLNEYINIPGFFGSVSATELGYLDGVTSAIQTQINAKQATITSGSISNDKLTTNPLLRSNHTGLMDFTWLGGSGLADGGILTWDAAGGGGAGIWIPNGNPFNASNLSSGTLPDARFPATLPALSGVNLTTLNASNLSSGTVPPARLGSGTANSTTFLRGDNTWQAVAGGSSDIAALTTNSRRVTDGVVSGTSLTSATAAFAAGDASKVIQIRGAGAGGGTHSTTIASVTNSTTVVLTAAAPTAIASAADFTIIHGTTALNTAISANAQPTLRAAKAIGYNRQADTTKGDLWRPYVKKLRQINSPPPNVRSFRTLSLGDSVAVNIGGFMNMACGYGGEYLIAGAGTGAVGVSDWALSPTGNKQRLDTNGDFATLTPLGIGQAVGLTYIAQSGGGTVKVQYQVAKTGGWVDATNAWSISPKSDNCQTVLNHNVIAPRDHHQILVGDTVTGTGIPGGTTVTAVSTAAVNKTGSTTNGSASVTLDSVSGLAIGMRCSAGALVDQYISAITVASNTITMSSAAFSTTSSQPLTFHGPAVTLSANATTTATNNLTFRHPDCGTDSGGGLLNTDNGGAAKYATAWIILPNTASGTGPAYYNVRVTHTGTGGNADIIGGFWDNGAFGFGITNATAPTGSHIGMGIAAAGTSLAAAHSVTTEETWIRSLAALDPDIITYKTANALTISNLQTYWPEYARRLRVAAPDALLVVVGSHSSGASPSRDDALLTECDNYWRDWCAENDGAIFIDMRANTPQYNANFWTADGLWQDGIHPYRGGMDWANLMTWDTVRPSVEAAAVLNSYQTANNPTRPMFGFGNEVRLTGAQDNSVGGALWNTFSVNAEHAIDSYNGIRQNNKGFTGHGTSGFTGFGQKASTAGANMAGHVFGMTNGVRYSQWTDRGSFHGYGISTGDTVRANTGHRWNATPTYLGFPGFVVEGQHGNSSHSVANMAAVFGVDINSTLTTAGAKLWEWMPDGRVVNNGVVWKPSAAVTLQGTTTILCTDTSGLATGMTVWGDGIPAAATISTINTNTSIVISAAATLSGNRSLAFTRAGSQIFTYGESGSDVTIHTPAQSGTVAVILTGTGSLDYGSIAALGEETLTVTVTGAVTTNTPSVELGWSAALETGIVVKQAWVSATNTVSVRVANITAGAIDPAAITCRATVDNF